MNAMTVRTPWHLWAVGALALLWNGFGGYLYVMTQMQGAEFLRSMGSTQAAIDWQASMPAWMNALWAIRVWGGVLGAVLLLMRMKWAMYAFLASLLAMLVSLIASLTIFDGMEVYTTAELIQTAVVTFLAIGFVMYSRMMARKGVLR
ncbi:hypothetical protein [Brevundimonas sp.]|uniref:hypothetical protein n=1 Tax=Brevundimonas sp. TaxID=1871086 RepID=UPI001DECBD66|nr:hypothetical protein [Brevundimonas sp.]MBL0947217.1 hypothetical protein [Brevundimonas sp.]